MIQRDWLYVTKAARTPKERTQRLLSDVATKHALSLDELLASKGKHAAREARYEAMYELRRSTRLSLPQIAQMMGGLHHTSVLHGIRRHAERIGAA